MFSKIIEILEKVVINFHIVFLVVDHCLQSNPCSENGQCRSPPGANETVCDCNPGFQGNLCQCERFSVVVYNNFEVF